MSKHVQVVDFALRAMAGLIVSFCIVVALAHLGFINENIAQLSYF